MRGKYVTISVYNVYHPFSVQVSVHNSEHLISINHIRSLQGIQLYTTKMNEYNGTRNVCSKHQGVVFTGLMFVGVVVGK